jgi:hypothetical protein
VRDDRLVFHLQRGAERAQVSRLAVVIFVEDGGGEDAGRRRRHERLAKRARRVFQDRLEVRAFGPDRAVVLISHRADRLRQLVERGNLHLGGVLLVPHLPEYRIAIDVRARRAFPAAAQPGKPVAQVEKKRFALLLAVVADVDAGLRLFGHHPGERRLAGGIERSRIDCLAARAGDIEARQLFRARQAARVGRENAVVAAQH